MATILVTGGNRGIGFGIVQAISRRLPTSTVIIACRSISAGNGAIDEGKKLGLTASLDVIQLDIEDDESITKAVSAVESKYGKLDGRRCARGYTNSILTVS